MCAMILLDNCSAGLRRDFPSKRGHGTAAVRKYEWPEGGKGE